MTRPDGRDPVTLSAGCGFPGLQRPAENGLAADNIGEQSTVDRYGNRSTEDKSEGRVAGRWGNYGELRALNDRQGARSDLEGEEGKWVRG